MSHPTSGPIGAAVPNRNSARLVAGRGRYVADMRAPRQATAVFVRSQQPHAWITSVDTAEASRAPGVLAVFTAADLPAVSLVSEGRRAGLHPTPQPVLARDRVRFVGEAVALVVAEDAYLAEDAAEMVFVDYEPLPPHMDPRRPLAPDAVGLADDVPGDLVIDEREEFGEVDAAFAEAAHIARVSLTVGRTTASPMETRGCLADYDPTTDQLRVWSSTQGPHRLRNKIAEAIDMDENRVNVIMHDVGGAFGQKIPAQPEEIVICLASRALGRPVKWIEDRREHLMSAPHSRGTILDLELAVDAEATILGLRADIIGDAGAYSFNSASALTEPFLAARRMPGCYRIENYAYHMVARLTNKSPIAPYRGVGNVAAQTAREMVLDEAAALTGVDRVEARRKNIVSEAELPYRTCTGLILDSGSFLASFEKTIDEISYPSFLEEQRSARAQGRHLGLGLSVFIEGVGAGTELSQQLYGTPAARKSDGVRGGAGHDSARVSFDQSGKVTISFGTTGQGQGIETTMAQVAASVLGLDLDDVTVALSDTSTTPVSIGGTRASRVAVVMGGAVGRASTELRRQLLAVAAQHLECDANDLVVADGHVSVAGSPDIRVSVGDIVHAGFRSPDHRPDGDAPMFSATEFYDPGATYGNGAIACIVEVDEATGRVDVRRIVVTDDCGTVINQAIVDGQIRGGVTQGIGSALLERLHYDAGGQIVTTTFMDFLLPTASDIPKIEVHHMSSPSAKTWGGIKGVGEAGTIGAPAAVVGAVCDAAMIRPGAVDELPLLPNVVSDLMRPRADVHDDDNQ